MPEVPLSQRMQGGGVGVGERGHIRKHKPVSSPRPGEAGVGALGGETAWDIWGWKAKIWCWEGTAAAGGQVSHHEGSWTAHGGVWMIGF